MSKVVSPEPDGADDRSAKLKPSLNPHLDRVLQVAAERKGPAVYLPVFCKDVVQVMGEGYSLTAFAGAVGVSRAMLDTWRKRHPAFAVANEQGRAARTRALETQFLTAGTGAKVAAHVFALKNAAPEDWREHPGAETKGRGGQFVFISNDRDGPARPPNAIAPAEPDLDEPDGDEPDCNSVGGGDGR